jgi:excisionase family DNA binding protein
VHHVQTKLFLTPAEVATELAVSPATVLRLIHRGDLPAILVSERIYRIPSAGFELYKAGKLRVAAPAPVRDVEQQPDLRGDERLPVAPAPARTSR